MDADLTLIRKALGDLPKQCRYHHDSTGPDGRAWGQEACCDTGVPAQRRKLAEQALQRLSATQATQPDDTLRDRIADALQGLAPGHPAVRVWGRMAGATPEQGQDGNAWAADPEDIADLVIEAMRQGPDLH